MIRHQKLGPKKSKVNRRNWLQGYMKSSVLRLKGSGGGGQRTFLQTNKQKLS